MPPGQATIKQAIPPTSAKPKKEFLRAYLCRAPIALALEKALECEIFSGLEVMRPVADYGCGDGLFASVLLDSPADAGIDVCGSALKTARKNGAYKQVLHARDADVQLGSGSMNTVICNSVLEHVKDLERTLGRIHCLLSDRGRVYLTVPSEEYDRHTVAFNVLKRLDWHTAAERSRKAFNAFWNHAHHYPEKVWAEHFARAGFEVVGTQRYASARICLWENICLPLAAPALINKYLFGRWILSETLRRATTKGIHRMFKKQMMDDGKGALIFFALKKNDGS